MLEGYELIYIAVVAVSGALLIWWSRRKLSRIQRQKSRRIRRLRHFGTVPSSTPLDDPVAHAKETAVESIQSRFSVIRRFLFYAIVVVWLAALAFPFLHEAPAAVVSVLVAASGILVGIAARPLIENLISGVVLSLSRSIRLGDTVRVDGVYGTVEDISLTHTTIKIWNWRRYLIPNSRMLNKEITNYTIQDAYQWAHVEFRVAYDSDIDVVRKLAVESAKQSSHCASYEEPRFWVMETLEKGTKCWVAAWADSPAEAWELESDIRAELTRQLRAHGLKTHRVELAHSRDGRPSERPR